MKIVIVTGPQSCGKTRNAERIKKLFNASLVIDSENLDHDLTLTKDMVTSETRNLQYHGSQPNPYYNTTVVIITNKSVMIEPHDRYLSSIHTFSSLNLE